MSLKTRAANKRQRDLVANINDNDCQIAGDFMRDLLNDPLLMIGPPQDGNAMAVFGANMFMELPSLDAGIPVMATAGATPPPSPRILPQPSPSSPPLLVIVNATDAALAAEAAKEAAKEAARAATVRDMEDLLRAALQQRREELNKAIVGDLGAVVQQMLVDVVANACDAVLAQGL